MNFLDSVGKTCVSGKSHEKSYANRIPYCYQHSVQSIFTQSLVRYIEFCVPLSMSDFRICCASYR